MREGRVAAWCGVLGVALLSACTVGPEHEAPEVSLPEAWRFGTEGTLETADVAWWQFFEDPVLDGLVEEALRSNIDVRLAAARVEEFGARIGITRSAAFPQIGYGAEAGRSEISREIGAGKLGGEHVSDFFNAGLNAGWEIDLWGRIRRATEAARADVLAAEESRRGVILTLVTSVAASYIALRSLDMQLEVAHRKLETRRDTVALFELQFEKGVISQLELAQIRSEYERTAATIPALQRDIALLENSLSVLLGRAPGAIARGRSLEELTLPPVPAGLPSDLLRRRPDLREAEQRMLAANERVGVAVAGQYPRLSLTALLGVASDELSNLASADAGTWTLAAGLAGPLFTGGRLRAEIDAAKAVERQTIEAYLLTILTALREAEDALVTRSTTLDEAAAQSRQTEALAQYASLANRRYDNGYVSYLEVLDAERDLFDAELTRIRLRASLHASVIAIYKAFGGGWVDVAAAGTDIGRRGESASDVDGSDDLEEGAVVDPEEEGRDEAGGEEGGDAPGG